MIKHVITYLRYFDIGETDTWQCEACTKQDHIQNFEIHHIRGRVGKEANDIKNLMCLCKKCHSKAHSSKDYVSKDEFEFIHRNFMAGNRKRFLK